MGILKGLKENSDLIIRKEGRKKGRKGEAGRGSSWFVYEPTVLHQAKPPNALQVPCTTSANPVMSRPELTEPGKSLLCFTDFPAVGSFPRNRHVNQKHAVHIVNTLFNHFYKFSISVGAVPS